MKIFRKIWYSPGFSGHCYSLKTKFKMVASHVSRSGSGFDHKVVCGDLQCIYTANFIKIRKCVAELLQLKYLQAVCHPPFLCTGSPTKVLRWSKFDTDALCNSWVIQIKVFFVDLTGKSLSRTILELFFGVWPLEGAKLESNPQRHVFGWFHVFWAFAGPDPFTGLWSTW